MGAVAAIARLVPVVVVPIGATSVTGSAAVVLVVVGVERADDAVASAGGVPVPPTIEGDEDGVEHGETLLCGPDSTRPRPHPYG